MTEHEHVSDDKAHSDHVGSPSQTNYITNNYEEEFMSILNSTGGNLSPQQLMVKNKLHVLFLEIDKEFDSIVRENELLRARVEEYERLNQTNPIAASLTPIPPAKTKKTIGNITKRVATAVLQTGKKDVKDPVKEVPKSAHIKDGKDNLDLKNKDKKGKGGMQKVRDFMATMNATQRAQQKPTNPLNKAITRRYLYHTDAVWKVKAIPYYSMSNSTQLIASTSNDGTTCIWTADFFKTNDDLHRTT
ncbi:1-deoxy-D-xylulose-5-phosphate synthase [Acrasis kona]|uniref:1-deoxy-D-xylulose-5-phosphate synthase n=1 Tax=Acrasis kona TaxID=1008807 RepID=A0AAW2ZCX2_9EUKA